MNYAHEFTYEGVWWSADNPSARFTGKLLRDSDNRLWLELIVENPPINLFDIVSIEVIFGNTIEGTQFTLFGCHRTGKQSTTSGLLKLIFSVEIAIEGLSSSDDTSTFEALLVDEMSFGYTGLEEWFEDQAMIFSPKTSRDGNITTVEIAYTDQKIDSVFIDDIQANVTFGYRVHRPESWTRNTSLTIEFNIHAFFKIQPTAPQTMSWFFIQSKQIRDFLSLCMRQPLSTTHAFGVVTKQQFPVTVYLSQHTPLENIRSSDTMIFAYQHLSSGFSDMLKIWFEKTERLKVLVSLALSVLYRGYRLPEFEFLALIQALEGYHKTDHPEPPKIALKKRLEDLKNTCVAHDSALGLFINASDNQLTLWVNTRNYLSHRQRKANEPVLEDEHLSDAIGWLVNWVNILIFIELETPKSVSISDALRHGVIYSSGRRLW
jgi:hypothetical protein